jgi:hypothetical protein
LALPGHGLDRGLRGWFVAAEPGFRVIAGFPDRRDCIAAPRDLARRRIPVKLVALIVPMVLAAAPLPLRADLFTMDGTTYQVAHVTGTGTNKALLEVDFGTNVAPQAYLFGYQWNGPTITGRDLLQAIQAGQTGLSFTETYFASFDSYLLNTLWYQSNQPADDYPNAFWFAFTSPDGVAWTDSSTGYDQTPVSNDGFFGWALQHDDPNDGRDFSLPPLPPSHFPAAIVVPEPVSGAFALAGVVSILLRRTRPKGATDSAA